MMKKDDFLYEINDLEDIHSCLYFLLERFHEICEKNGIYYVLFAGSMLGAVRHQGIIPWDDDIDVCVPREDYEKLSKIISNDFPEFEFRTYPDDYYVLNFGEFCYKNSKLIVSHYPAPYNRTKLYIDVFPVDGFPPKNDKKHFDKMRKYRRKIREFCMPIEVSKKWYKKAMFIPRLIVKFVKKILGINYKYYLKKLNDEQRKYKISDCEYVCLQGAQQYENGKMPKEIFFKRSMFRFGKKFYFGLENYDFSLTKLYGNYWELPSLSERVPKHSYSLFVDKALLKKAGLDLKKFNCE